MIVLAGGEAVRPPPLIDVGGTRKVLKHSFQMVA